MTDNAAGSEIPASPAARDKVFPAFFAVAALVGLVCSLWGWNGSLMEYHSFRQTQTAITVQYLLKGSDWLRYETPVLGPPWSIPMEFPFYQYLVALLTKATGYAIDQSGRLVSLLFFVSLFYPLYRLARPWFEERNRAFIPLTLLCLSPQYLYWSRTFMIESTALALCVWYVYLIDRYLKDDGGRRNLAVVFFVLGTAVIASVTKVTTFFAYYAAAFVLVAIATGWSGAGVIGSLKRNGLLIVAAFILPLASIAVWTRFSDGVKVLNPIGKELASASAILTAWNFGTMEQKVSGEVWGWIFSRSLTDLLGAWWLFPVLVLLLPFCRRKTIILSAVLFALFLLPMLVFTNLYYVHNYYVYANGIFLLLAVSLPLADVSRRGNAGFAAALVLMGAVAVASAFHYVTDYLPAHGSDSRYQEIRKDVDRYTRPDDILVFFGADWSSEMPYYLERRSLMFADSLTNPSNYLQSVRNMMRHHAGAVFFCEGSRDDNAANITKILGDFRLAGQSRKVSYDKCDVYYSTKENTQ